MYKYSFFREFDHHASKIIDRCFHIDNEFAVKILLTPSKVYSDHTPLILAEFNKSRVFLATKTMWKHLDRIWFEDVNEKGHSKLFISFLVNSSEYI